MSKFSKLYLKINPYRKKKNILQNAYKLKKKFLPPDPVENLKKKKSVI